VSLVTALNLPMGIWSTVIAQPPELGCPSKGM